MIYPHALNINHDPAVAGPCISCKENIFINPKCGSLLWRVDWYGLSEGSFSLRQSLSLFKTFAAMILSLLGTIRIKQKQSLLKNSLLMEYKLLIVAVSAQ